MNKFKRAVLNKNLLTKTQNQFSILHNECPQSRVAAPMKFNRPTLQNDQNITAHQQNMQFHQFMNGKFLSDESGFHSDFKTVKKPPSQDFNQLYEQKKEEIDKAVHNHKIVLFMKGVPEVPECGFSNAVVTILKKYGVDFVSYNMNKDIVMKEALKEYSDWPTIPQLYVNGEFVGGCDIILNLHKHGELEDVLEVEEHEES